MASAYAQVPSKGMQRRQRSQAQRAASGSRCTAPLPAPQMACCLLPGVDDGMDRPAHAAGAMLALGSWAEPGGRKRGGDRLLIADGCWPGTFVPPDTLRKPPTPSLKMPRRPLLALALLLALTLPNALGEQQWMGLLLHAADGAPGCRRRPRSRPPGAAAHNLAAATICAVGRPA